MDGHFVYLCIGSVLLCAGHRCVCVPFRSLRHGHGPTVFAGSEPFLIVLAPVRTCLAGVAMGRAEITPRPSLCSYALDVSYMSTIVTGIYCRNAMPELYWLGKWICRCSPCMAAERYGGQSYCRVRDENSIIVIASACSRVVFWRRN